MPVDASSEEVRAFAEVSGLSIERAAEIIGRGDSRGEQLNELSVRIEEWKSDHPIDDGS